MYHRTVREDEAIVNICMVVSGRFFLFFHGMSAGRHSDSALQAAGVFLSVFTTASVRLYDAGSNPDSSRELVSCGNEGGAIC